MSNTNTLQKTEKQANLRNKYEMLVKPRLEEIFNWLQEGYTEYSICTQLGICQDTWIRYKKTFSELTELYTRAQEERNALVRNAIHRRAVGFREKTQRVSKGEVVEVEEYYPGDVKAQQLWAYSKMPEEFQEKQQIDHNVHIQVDIDSSLQKHIEQPEEAEAIEGKVLEADEE